MLSLHEFILGHLDLLLYRDHQIDLFTETEKLPISLVDGKHQPQYESEMYLGKLCDFQGTLCYVSQLDPFEITELNHKVTPILCAFNEPITVPANAIANYKGPGDMKTRLGILVVNYVFLAEPFGDKLPYINETIRSISQIEGPMMPLVLDGIISNAEFNNYKANAFHLGQFSELCVPVFSPKSLMTSPAVKKRKKELLEEHRDALERGDPVIMNKIENELIALDKEWMKDDPAMGFLGADPGKSFGVHRKKMFIAGGMTEAFGEKGQFAFVENSLTQGWTKKDFPVLCNEIRSGSYSRAIETANGGVETKFIIRVFQNTNIIEEDCGTEKYLTVTLSKDLAKEFLFRYILHNGKLIELTEETIKDFIGKTVRMRSPMCCHTKGGYCSTCAGGLFKRLDQKSITFAAVALSSSFTTASLKKMHGGQMKTFKLTGLNKFVLGRAI